MSRQTAIIIGAVVAVVLLAVAGGMFFVNSQQRVVVGSTAAPTFAPPPTVRVASTAVPSTPGSPELSPGRTVATPASPEAPPSSPETSPVPSIAPTSLGASPVTSPTLTPALEVAVPITPVRLSASGYAPNSEDAQGNVTTFVAENAADGRPETAWRIAGDGVNQWLLVEFSRPVELRELRILPGYAKIDERDGTNRFLQNRRVRRVRLEFSTGGSVEVVLDDMPVLQPILTDNVRTEFVRIVILESLPPAVADGREFTPISEIEALGVVR